jgi:hypothetical protein
MFQSAKFRSTLFHSSVSRSIVRRSWWLSLLVASVFNVSSVAQDPSPFVGDWVLKLGNRAFAVLSVVRSGSKAEITGSLVHPQHFSSSNGYGIYGIRGAVAKYAIVGAVVKEKCLSFTAQNPSDPKDNDDFEFCVAGSGEGSLRYEIPGFASWPVSKANGPPVVANDWDSSRTYFVDDSEISNPDMQRIFDEDQKDRQPGLGNIDWQKISKADAARRAETAKLLAANQLHSGEDFQRAAFVFQHGEKPDDYLLAHTLAMVAVARGDGSAMWIAAATLDRYLQSIQQPQVYGTQFFTKDNEPTTQEPYNRSLIPDSLRGSLGVPSQAAQEEQRKRYDEEGRKH